MKITITYQPGEDQQARSILDQIRHQLGKVKIKHSDRHKPYLHIYIAKEPPTGTNLEKDS